MSIHVKKSFYISADLPSMPELLRLRVPQQIADRYSIFGFFLLNDKTGSQVDIIEDECHGTPERIVQKISQEWLEGKGLPVTWKSLIQTLRDTDLQALADQIEMTHGGDTGT